MAEIKPIYPNYGYYYNNSEYASALADTHSYLGYNYHTASTCFRFKISDLEGIQNLESAKLYLYKNPEGRGDITWTCGVQGTEITTWRSEETWKSRKNLDAQISGLSATAKNSDDKGYVSWDITSLISYAIKNYIDKEYFYLWCDGTKLNSGLGIRYRGYNYSSGTKPKIEITYSSGPIDLSTGTVTGTFSPSTFFYTGQNQYPVSYSIYFNGNLLVDEQDYTIVWPEESYLLGEKDIYIIGRGNYDGVVQMEGAYEIVSPPLIDLNDTSQIRIYNAPSREYSQGSLEPKPIVEAYRNGAWKTLELGWDYDIVFIEDFIDVGKYSYTIKGDEEYGYTGEVQLTFEITPAPLSDTEIKLSQSSFNYNGQSQIPKVEVNHTFFKKPLLIEGRDYSISYSREDGITGDSLTIEPGTITITIKGKGNFTGEEKKEYTILKNTVSLSECTIILEPTSVFYGNSYLGNGLFEDGTKINITISYNGMKLIEGKDYEYTIPSDIELPGDYLISIEAKGYQYSGTVYKTFTVKKAPIVIDKIADQTYTGEEIRPDITFNGGKKADEDLYDIKFENNTNRGTAKVILTALSDSFYEGTASATFTILPRDLSGGITGTFSPSVFTYNGNNQYPNSYTITFHYENGARQDLVKNKDYEITWPSDSYSIGAKKVIIQGINNYTGQSTIDNAYIIQEEEVTLIDLSDATKIKISKADSKEYNSYSFIPKPIVQVNKNGAWETLSAGIDYKVLYDGTLINAGNYPYTIMGIESSGYTGHVAKDSAGETLIFTITSAKLSAATINISPLSFVYNGESQIPSVTITHPNLPSNNNILIEKQDYSITYSRKDNTEESKVTINAGVINITITGKKNFSGSVVKTYSILQKNFSEGTITGNFYPSSFFYNGENQYPSSYKIYFDEKLLIEAEDYTISWPSNSYSIGTKNVVINGIGNYTGRSTIYNAYKIQEENIYIDLSDSTKVRIFNAEPQEYTRIALEPKPTVQVKEGEVWRELEMGLDYDIFFEEEELIDAGKYSYSIIGYESNGYTGRAEYDLNGNKLIFEITPAKLSDAIINISPLSFEYDGSSHIPKITIEHPFLSEEAEDFLLVEGRDYLISYSREDGITGPNITVEIGIITISITGRNNFTGTEQRTYSINEKTILISDCDIAISPESIEYMGESIENGSFTDGSKIEITISYGETLLEEGTDYIYQFPAKMEDPGNYEIIISGKNTYSGTVTKVFTIKKASFTIDSIPDQIYTGKEIKPTIKINGEEISEEELFSIYFSNNINVGIATVKVSALENNPYYTGSATTSFNIIKNKGFHAYIRVNNTFCPATAFIYKNGVWKECLEVDVKILGAWKKTFV